MITTETAKTFSCTTLSRRNILYIINMYMFVLKPFDIDLLEVAQFLDCHSSAFLFEKRSLEVAALHLQPFENILPLDII